MANDRMDTTEKLSEHQLIAYASFSVGLYPLFVTFYPDADYFRQRYFQIGLFPFWTFDEGDERPWGLSLEISWTPFGSFACSASTRALPRLFSVTAEVLGRKWTWIPRCAWRVTEPPHDERKPKKARF